MVQTKDTTPLGRYPKRCLGLIGGLGVGAAMHYYRELTTAHEQSSRALDLLMAHAQMSIVFEHIRSGNTAGLAQYLAELIDRMRAGGAQVAAIPAVTPHLCFAELNAISPLPLISILPPIAEEICTRGLRRIAIFGTRLTIESGLFGSLEGVDLVMPKPSEVDFIHDTYFRIAQNGPNAGDDHAALTALAHTLCVRDQVDAILLAGTDLSLLFTEANTEFPSIDSSRLHIRSIVHALLD